MIKFRIIYLPIGEEEWELYYKKFDNYLSAW